MSGSSLVFRTLIVGLFAATWIKTFAAADIPKTVEVPKYCDVSGHLTLENCSLVNNWLAKEFFDSVNGRATKARYSESELRRIHYRINEKCSGVWRQSRKITGGGTLDDVVERECLADGYHSAAMKIAGLRGKRQIIRPNSTQIPTYCLREENNLGGCAYINRLIAVDFFRRVVTARESYLRNSSIKIPDLEKVEADCLIQISSAHIGKTNDDELDSLHCVRDRLHDLALQLLQ